MHLQNEAAKQKALEAYRAQQTAIAQQNANTQKQRADQAGQPKPVKPPMVSIVGPFSSGTDWRTSLPADDPG